MTVMHECITRLLKSSFDEEALECFGKLIMTTGKDLDKPETKVGVVPGWVWFQVPGWVWFQGGCGSRVGVVPGWVWFQGGGGSKVGVVQSGCGSRVGVVPRWGWSRVGVVPGWGWFQGGGGPEWVWFQGGGGSRVAVMLLWRLAAGKD